MDGLGKCFLGPRNPSRVILRPSLAHKLPYFTLVTNNIQAKAVLYGVNRFRIKD
jgi:hypothetical protein